MDLNIKGIKCDNPNCDFKDMGVRVEDYDKWLNRPCPKCGADLLTEKDYKTVKHLLKFTKLINKIMPNQSNDDKDVVKGTINIKWYWKYGY